MKIIGVCILSLTVIAWGNAEAVRVKKKTRRVDDYLELLRYIRAQIDCFSRPIGDILTAYFEENNFADAKNRVAIHADLQNTILADVYLYDDVKKELLVFAENVGEGSKDETLRLCDFTLAQLEVLAGQYRAEYPGKARLWRTLPFLACLSLLILFL